MLNMYYVQFRKRIEDSLAPNSVFKEQLESAGTMRENIEKYTFANSRKEQVRSGAKPPNTS